MMPVERYEIILCRDERKHLTLDLLASRSGLHPRLVELYVECGLLEPIEWEGARLLFDPSAIPRLRLIARLRKTLGLNVAGVAVTLDLIDRLRALKRENETLRSRL
jgi:DNA-binding transcriptional MerR regulator